MSAAVVLFCATSHLNGVKRSVACAEKNFQSGYPVGQETGNDPLCTRIEPISFRSSPRNRKLCFCCYWLSETLCLFENHSNGGGHGNKWSGPASQRSAAGQRAGGGWGLVRSRFQAFSSTGWAWDGKGKVEQINRGSLTLHSTCASFKLQEFSFSCLS